MGGATWAEITSTSYAETYFNENMSAAEHVTASPSFAEQTPRNSQATGRLKRATPNPPDTGHKTPPGRASLRGKHVQYLLKGREVKPARTTPALLIPWLVPLSVALFPTRPFCYWQSCTSHQFSPRPPAHCHFSQSVSRRASSAPRGGAALWSSTAPR